MAAWGAGRRQNTVRWWAERGPVAMLEGMWRPLCHVGQIRKLAELAQVPPRPFSTSWPFWAQHQGCLPQVPSKGSCISRTRETSEPSWPLPGHQCPQTETRASSDPTELGRLSSHSKEKSTMQLWRQDRCHWCYFTRGTQRDGRFGPRSPPAQLRRGLFTRVCESAS